MVSPFTYVSISDKAVDIRGCCVWQQCEVSRACAGSRRAERRKQAMALSRDVLCYVG